MRKLALILALLVLACASAFAQNKLSNPGFEQTPIPAPDDPIPGWTFNNEGWTDMTDFHYAVQSEDVYSGANALKLYLGPTSWGAGWGIYQTCFVIPGEVYEASAMWKVTGADPGDTNLVSLLVFPGSWWDNKSLDVVYAVHSELNAYSHPAFQPMNFDWESTKNAPFTAYEPTDVAGTARYRSRVKATSTKMTVWIKMTSRYSPNTTLYVDDATLEQVSAAYSVTGTVYDSVTGQPVPDANVVCSTGGTATSDANGIYKIYFPDAGACSISASAAHYEDAVGISTTLTAKADNSLNITLVPKPTGVVSGVVTNGSTSMANANVWTADGEYSTIADETGHYSMTVEAGSYSIEANAVGYETSSVPATVVAGQTTSLNIVLNERYVDPQNALTNGDFEDGMTGWTEWSATHWSIHQNSDTSCPGYGDQWVVDGDVSRTWPEAVAGGGVNGTTGMKLTAYTNTNSNYEFGQCGGVRQQCYVTPGKYYRVRCKWQGRVLGTAEHYKVAVGLVDGRFDPGIYDPDEPAPLYADDVVMMEANARAYYELGEDSLPEQDRWWHNMMSSRSKAFGNTAWWEWRDSLENLEPRNNLVGAVKQATGETMTVVLYFAVVDFGDTAAHQAFFDDVVLEEVSGPPPVTLSMLNNVDTRPAYDGCDAPEINVDTTGSPSVVTGTFQDIYGYSCYVEDQERTTAFRVDIPDMFTPFVGDTITFKGVLGANDQGERRILMEEGSGVIVGSAQVPAPLGIGLKAMSGKFKYQNPLNDLSGPGNLGLLITTWGSVVSSFNDGWYDWVRIDDGTGREVWVSGWIGQPNPGAYVSATGILSISEMLDQEGLLYPVYLLKVRDDTAWDDFQVIQQ